MPTFNDSSGSEWRIAFDGLTLKELRDEHSIDLADLGAGDYARIDRDPAALTVALCCLCAEQWQAEKLTRRQFASRLTGEALEGALKAVWGAAKLFFPARQWSVLESNLATQKKSQEDWDQLRPMMGMLNQPDMPPAMKEAVMGALAEMMQKMTPSDSQNSQESTSATGPAATRLPNASNSPATAASTPAA